MNVPEVLARRDQERAGLADRLARLLADDPRVLAGWLHGSAGRGEADGLSDLDVTVVVADGSLAATAGGPDRPTTYERVRTSPRGRFVAGLGTPTLLTEAPQNAPAGGAFLTSFFPGSTGRTGSTGNGFPDPPQRGRKTPWFCSTGPMWRGPSARTGQRPTPVNRDLRRRRRDCPWRRPSRSAARSGRC